MVTIITQAMLNILLIDNRKTQSRKLKEALEASLEGYRVLTRSSALEALAEAKKAQPKVVIIRDTLAEARAEELRDLIVNAVGLLPVIIMKSSDKKSKKSSEIGENGLVTQLLSPSIAAVVLAVKENLKIMKLMREIENLRAQLKRAGFNKTIADLTLESSHRINDTLMTILGNSQLLLNDLKGMNAGAQTKLRKIEKAANEIKSITLSLANTLGTEIKQFETEKTTS